jgi:hypothetical protein
LVWWALTVLPSLALQLRIRICWTVQITFKSHPQLRKYMWTVSLHCTPPMRLLCYLILYIITTCVCVCLCVRRRFHVLIDRRNRPGRSDSENGNRPGQSDSENGNPGPDDWYVVSFVRPMRSRNSFSRPRRTGFFFFFFFPLALNYLRCCFENFRIGGWEILGYGFQDLGSQLWGLDFHTRGFQDRNLKTFKTWFSGCGISILGPGFHTGASEWPSAMGTH